MHHTSAVMICYQVESRYIKNVGREAAMDLFNEIFREPCFNKLRPHEQLNYNVLGKTTIILDELPFGFIRQD